MIVGGRDQITTLTEGMTTQRWMTEIEAVEVEIEDLIPTQPGVFYHALTEQSPMGDDPLPHAVEVNGLLFLEDGHHRVMRAALSGLTRMQIRVMKARIVED